MAVYFQICSMAGKKLQCYKKHTIDMLCNSKDDQ